MGESQTLNPAVLNRLRQEMANSGIDLVGELVAMYMVDAPEMVLAMRRAVSEGAAQQVKREAHGLKGSSANLGAELLTGCCHDVERLALSGDLQGANELLDLLEAELERVLAELKRLPELAA